MLDNQFALIEPIGQGGSSNVFRARDKENNEYAIKIIRKDKKYHKKLAMHMLSKEHEALTSLEGHPNLIKSFDVSFHGRIEFEDRVEDCMYQVIELAPQGAISNYVRKTGPFEEELVRFFMIQIFHAVNHLHLQNFVHLDIKLENIFLDEFFNIKLGDLGSSSNVESQNGFISSKRGTPLYMAPEVKLLEPGEEYDAFSADIYSLGICLFVLLTGEFPSPQDLGHTYESRETNESGECFSSPKFESKRFKHLSPSVRSLIQEMTDENDIARPSINDLLEHEWFSAPFGDHILESVYEEMEARRNFMYCSISKNEDFLLN